MIRVSKTSRKAVHAFNEKEWHGVDVEHYGRRVQWNEKPFIFKATSGKKIVGTISGKYKSEILTIDMLMVAKKERGKGIGKVLMEKAEVFGRKLGARKIHLETGKDWISAKFYEKLGYKKIAVLPKHNFGKDFIIYEKFLN